MEYKVSLLSLLLVVVIWTRFHCVIGQQLPVCDYLDRTLVQNYVSRSNSRNLYDAPTGGDDLYFTLETSTNVYDTDSTMNTITGEY